MATTELWFRKSKKIRSSELPFHINIVLRVCPRRTLLVWNQWTNVVVH